MCVHSHNCTLLGSPLPPFFVPVRVKALPASVRSGSSGRGPTAIPRAPRGLCQGQVAQQTVRPVLAVFFSPRFGYLLCLCLLAKCLAVQALVPEPAIRALHTWLLPHVGRCNEDRTAALTRQPLAHGFGSEFRAVVAEDMHRHCAADKQPLQRLAHHRLSIFISALPLNDIREGSFRMSQVLGS